MTAIVSGENLSYAEVVNDPALELNAFERQCGLLWPTHRNAAEVAALVNPVEYAEQADYSKTKWKAFQFDAERRVRWAVDRVFRCVEAAYYGEVREAAREYQRELLNACRNRQESGRSPETQVGAKPYGKLDPAGELHELTLKQSRAEGQKPQNFRAVSQRGALVSAGAVGKINAPAERLTNFARHLAARQELALPSI